MLTSSNELPMSENPSGFNIQTQTTAQHCSLSSFLTFAIDFPVDARFTVNAGSHNLPSSRWDWSVQHRAMNPSPPQKLAAFSYGAAQHRAARTNHSAPGWASAAELPAGLGSSKGFGRDSKAVNSQAVTVSGQARLTVPCKSTNVTYKSSSFMNNYNKMPRFIIGDRYRGLRCAPSYCLRTERPRSFRTPRHRLFQNRITFQMTYTTTTRMTWLRVGCKLPRSPSAVRLRSASAAQLGGSAPATLPTDPGAQGTRDGTAPASSPTGYDNYRAHPSHAPYLSFLSFFIFFFLPSGY